MEVNSVTTMENWKLKAAGTSLSQPFSLSRKCRIWKMRSDWVMLRTCALGRGIESRKTYARDNRSKAVVGLRGWKSTWQGCNVGHSPISIGLRSNFR
jgi:hypothetical protein